MLAFFFENYRHLVAMRIIGNFFLENYCAALVRVLSTCGHVECNYNTCFESSQEGALDLEDYIQASVMLQYNHRHCYHYQFIIILLTDFL